MHLFTHLKILPKKKKSNGILFMRISPVKYRIVLIIIIIVQSTSVQFLKRYDFNSR